jgi:hypothetical protein
MIERENAFRERCSKSHTATALPTGQVLVVGGMAEGGSGIATAELFDPEKNAVQNVASLGEGRTSHTATLLADGRVLVAGGYNGGYLASIEAFDPSANAFRAAGSLVEGRSGHTATLLPDGRVLFVGGVGRGWTYLRTAELYDPRTGRSELAGSMSVPREGHTATLLEDGRVLVVGGHAGRRPDVQVHATAEIFSPASGRFDVSGTLSTARHKHDAIRLIDGRVLIIGGADRTDRTHYATTEVFTARTGIFDRGPSMGHSRYKIAGTSVLLSSGSVLVTSGGPVAELLDVRRWTFHEVPGRYPEPYRFAATALLRDGDVFVSGGYSDRNRNTAGIWRFTPRTREPC